MFALVLLEHIWPSNCPLLLRLLRPLLASNHQLQHKTIEHQHYISAFYTDFYFESYAS